MELSAQLVKLVEPLEASSPCGESLDDSQALAGLEAYRVFGRLKAATEDPDWTALRKGCLDALAQSKDLRVLAHLVVVGLRTNALADSLRIFALVETWLERYWEQLHPRIDDDAIARRNALMFFADRVAVVETLRRVAVVKDPRLGSFSVRDFEVAGGALQSTDSDAKPATLGDINTALTQADRPALTEIHGLTVAAVKSLRGIEAMMLDRAGSASVPQLEPVVQVLLRLQQMLEAHVVVAPVLDTHSPSVQSAGEVVRDVGKIASRDDVLRALDAVMAYYRSYEPGSLVPVITERAKRLVTASFIDALAEVAPEVVDPVKKAVGMREPTS
jgi:type VI secretion system protein ImpA